MADLGYGKEYQAALKNPPKKVVNVLNDGKLNGDEVWLRDPNSAYRNSKDHLKDLKDLTVDK